MSFHAPPASRYDIGARTLEVVYEDLASLAADVLVSSDDNYLTMGGGVSAGLLRVAGASLRQHATKFADLSRPPSPLRRGDVVVTTAGRLSAKFVFHAITIDHDSGQGPTVENIRDATSRAMSLAEALHLRSVAFPALGTGVGGFPFNIAADAMVRTIVDRLDTDVCVEHVTIALRAREGVREADLNTFYAASVGVIAQWEQGKRLRTALGRLQAESSEQNRPDETARLSMLSDEVDTLLAELSSTPPTFDEAHDESRTRAVADLATRARLASERVTADSGKGSDQAEATQVEALRLSLAAARHRLGGLESQRAYGKETPESQAELAATTREIGELRIRIAALRSAHATRHETHRQTIISS
jgi:O-acetyl-ADP-ribose deacetylase (regulator of RNase III)